MTPRRSILAAVVAISALALGGCAAADKNAADTSSSSGSSNSGSAAAVESSSSSMSGMSMGSSSTGTTTIVQNGVPTPVPYRTIASGYWKDMKITAEETTPVVFYTDNGTSYSKVTPSKNTSFHLMVMLNDRHTGEPISYATVWATIYKGSKMIFNEQQWAMLSEYMGPHYGNNVTLPGTGTYKLKLIISPPAAALHVEYANMWTGHHTVTSTFTWSGK